MDWGSAVMLSEQQEEHNPEVNAQRSFYHGKLSRCKSHCNKTIYMYNSSDDWLAGERAHREGDLWSCDRPREGENRTVSTV